MKKAIIGISISLFLLFWVFWGVDWGLLRISFGKIRWSYIVLYIFALIPIYILRSFRWELLLRPLQRVGQKTLFPIASVGFLAIMILPARSGELVRPYLLSQKERIPMSAAMATIVVERILDVLTILIFLVIVNLTAQLPGWVIGAGYIAMGFIAVILIFLFLMIAKEQVLVKIAERVLRRFSGRILEGSRDIILSFSRGARILSHWRVMTAALFFSLALWGGAALLNYLMFLAFAFPLSLAAAFVLVIIMDLGLMIPTAPGFVGSFQFLCVIGLAIFGVGREEALSFSILAHVLQLMFVTALGLFFLPMMKIPGFSLVKKASIS